MVNIFVQMDSKDGACPEWVIVELQGDLETRSESASLYGKFIGDLHYTHKGQPVLIIGHHILHGSVVSLEKPIAVLKKSEQHDVDSMDTPSDNESLGYNVIAVAKKKLLFKTRPKPIIANVPKKV